MPGYRVGPITFLSQTQGFGLYEFDTTGQSTAQQLVKTSDGGTTWVAAATAVLPAWASNLQFADALDGYAWGQGELEVTHDGGEHWAVSISGVASGTQPVSIMDKSIWVAHSDFLETSSDGGTTWQRDLSLSLNPSLVTRVSSMVGFAFGCGPPTTSGTTAGYLARTEDGGASWTPMTSPACQFDARTVDLGATTADDLWLVEFGQPATDMSSKWVYRSSDGGQHWSTRAVLDLGDPSQDRGTIPTTGNFGPLFVNVSFPDRAWLAEDRGGLLVTTDGGVTWRSAYNDLAVDAEGSPYVFFLDATHGWSAAGDGLWRTTDGSNWVDISPAPSP